MATNESQESRYESKYGGNHVTPAQKIAEIICERMAKKKKTELPMKFWNTVAWKRTFLSQLLAANSLIKLYSPRAIFSGLRRAPFAYSLRAAFLDDIFQEEENKLKDFIDKQEEEAVKEVPVVPINTTEQPRPSFTNQKSKLDKLRDL